MSFDVLKKIKELKKSDMICAEGRYELVKAEVLKDMNSAGLILRHKKSGARVVVISNDDNNKVFSIGFKTPPYDDTGMQHIIEHSTLCGSRKYPVKDPFVELCKGSLNTFLNAMTYPDKTVYPVASCNDADFKNIMDVYMDAVFYPDMYNRKEIFKQEGWHYELEDVDDDVKYNGVVFNEMKGAFSSADDVLSIGSCSALRNLQLIQVILAQKTQTVLFLPLLIQLFLDFSVFLRQGKAILATLDGGKIGFYGNLQTKVLQLLADSCLLFALLCLINGRNNLLPSVIHPFFIFHIRHSDRAACASVDVIQRIIQIIQGILNFSQIGAMLFRLRQCFLCGQLRQLQCRLFFLCRLLHRCHLHTLLRRGKSLRRKHGHTLRPADAHRKGQRQCAFCLI